TNGVGSNVTFTVVATSCSRMSYQWYFNGDPLSFGTAASVTITNAQVTNAGPYQVFVSSVAGGSLSAVATLTISTNGAPTAVVQGFATYTNKPLAIAFTSLTNNCTDPDGDSVSVRS